MMQKGTAATWGFGLNVMNPVSGADYAWSDRGLLGSTSYGWGNRLAF